VAVVAVTGFVHERKAWRLVHAHRPPRAHLVDRRFHLGLARDAAVLRHVALA
jgi:hypothetical protein